LIEGLLIFSGYDKASRTLLEFRQIERYTGVILSCVYALPLDLEEYSPIICNAQKTERYDL
jgi:hypothetical protein